MGDISEDVVPAQQQQSTEDKTELCIGVEIADNKIRGSKQELVAITHKMTQIEETSEYCIAKMEYHFQSLNHRRKLKRHFKL